MKNGKAAALHPGTDQVEREKGKMSGVASGQMKATKYVVFRYVATSFFTGYVCDFHEKHQQSMLWVRITCSYENSITLLEGVLQGGFICAQMASKAFYCPVYIDSPIYLNKQLLPDILPLIMYRLRFFFISPIIIFHVKLEASVMIDQNSHQSDAMQSLSLPGTGQGGNDDVATAAMTTKAIQNAFQMGWSIQDLKSRVLLGALGLPSTLSIASLELEPTPATHPPLSLDTLLQSLLPPTPESAAQNAADEYIRKLAHVDDWRASFIRIAVIHDQCFPASTTLNTPYDPSPDKPLNESFPYLYPSLDPNYALVGINGSETLGGEGDLDDAGHLEYFEIYDVARRALNCLALLSTKLEESLIPNMIRKYQTLIVEALFRDLLSSDPSKQGALQNVTAISNAVQESLEQEAVAILQQYITEALASPFPESVSLAIKILSFLLVRFLDSWDGYVSENYYVGGQIKNDSLELIAYEAGRSLASLVWGVSLITMVAENASTSGQDQTVLNRLCTTWLTAFDAAPLNLLSRQISTLGSFLDDDYYILKKVPRPVDGAKPSPEVPSRSIHAITYSLVYWQRAIQWICQPSSNGEASPTRMTMDVSRKLRQTLINQAGIWHSLILGGQTLRSFASQGVTRKIMSTLMDTIEEAVETDVKETSESVYKRFRVPIIVGGSLLLVIIVGGITLLALTKQLEGLLTIIGLLVGSGITAVSAFLTRAGTFVSSEERNVGALGSKSVGGGQSSGLFSLAGGEIVAVFQSAYKQIQIEYDDLNHYTAITYPLIDLFIQKTEPLWQDITDSYSFLTSVVWTHEDQEEELEQISRAALGPLGVWAGSLKKQAQDDIKQRGKVSPVNNQNQGGVDQRATKRTT